MAKLVEADGKAVMIGAPYDTMTLLHHAEHHAEHLADIPDKRVIRYEVPLATATGTRWQFTEEFDTSVPVAPFMDRFETDPFALIVEAFLAGGGGSIGMVGRAPSLSVAAKEVVGSAVRWLESQAVAHRERR